MIEQNNQFNFIASKLKILDNVNSNIQNNTNNVQELKNNFSIHKNNKDENNNSSVINQEILQS